MPGIRIRHPDPAVWGQTVLVPHPGDPRTGRKPKDYYLRLDSEGCIIVSTTIFRRLEEAKACGLSPHAFVMVNVVEDPPTQGIGSAPEQQRRILRQEGAALRELTPPGVKPRVVSTHTGPAKRLGPPQQQRKKR